MSALCSSCKTPIIWVLTKAGKKMPLNAVPEKRFMRVSRTLSDEPVFGMVDTYVSHFAVCPNANYHRKK